MKFTVESRGLFWQEAGCHLGFLFFGRSMLQAAVLLAFIMPTVAFGQDAPDFFRANCATCHTIGGGRLTGPDLKGVGKRKDTEWLINFIQNPKSVVDSGDAYAAKLVEASRGIVMPTAPGMTRYRAEKLLELIAAESKLEKSQFQGVKISNEPFTDIDRKIGHEIFIGVRPLAKGGTSCVSCHSIHGLSSLGGGQLGPDLTRVYERLKGRKPLSAWLMAPATATMQPIFKKHPLEAKEIHALAAYFEETAKHSEPSVSGNRIAFLFAGLALAAGIIFLFDFIWKGRFHSVRRPLVEAIRRAVHQGTSNKNKQSAASIAATEAGSEQGLGRGDQ